MKQTLIQFSPIMSFVRILFISILFCFTLNLPAIAQSGAQASSSTSEIDMAFQAAGKVKTEGPATIRFKDQATLAIPASQIFVPQPEAGRLMRAMGNNAGDNLLGVIFPQEGNWMIVAKYEASGYIKDDDAKDWNADELLKSLKEGTEEQNKEREKMGITALEVAGWAEAPRYDASAHRLIWSIIARDKNSQDNNPGINYNTYALGRDGYISLNLVTTASEVGAQKSIAKNLLGQLSFVEGKRYSDFNASTDKVAEYGLAALVAGVAVKKIGFFALIAAFLAKSFKLVIAAALGLAALVRKFFSRKSAADEEASAVPALPDTPVMMDESAHDQKTP